MNWNDYFIRMAKLVATKSKDPKTKVGAVLVGEDNQIISTGYNGFPRKFSNSADRWQRPTKYQYVVHAEANCICNAALSGATTKECRLYITHYPCNECVKLIIQAGINKIYIAADAKILDRKTYNIDFSKTMLKECGIEVIQDV